MELASTSPPAGLPQPLSLLIKIHANNIRRPAGPPHIYAKSTVSGASLTEKYWTIGL